jgi:hypothetical protein
MHDQVHNVSEAASSVSAVATAKSVALGSTVIGAGEVAKNSAGGWMLTYFFPFIDINTIQLFQFVGGLYMTLQVIRYCRDEWERYETKKLESQATTKPRPSDRFVVSVANGKDKPPPRDNSNS